MTTTDHIDRALCADCSRKIYRTTIDGALGPWTHVVGEGGLMPRHPAKLRPPVRRPQPESVDPLTPQESELTPQEAKRQVEAMHKAGLLDKAWTARFIQAIRLPGDAVYDPDYRVGKVEEEYEGWVRELVSTYNDLAELVADNWLEMSPGLPMEVVERFVDAMPANWAPGDE